MYRLNVSHLNYRSLAIRWQLWCLKRTTVGVICVFLLHFAGPNGAGAQPIDYNDGPIMASVSTVKVFLIFWQPSGAPSFHVGPDANGDQKFKDTIQRFFQDIGGSDYFTLARQYTQPCNKFTPCSPGPLSFGGSFDDVAPYPRSPLQNQDIENSITRARDANSWDVGLNALYFVLLPAEVQVCQPSGACTGSTFCAYHGHSDDGNVIYAVMPAIAAMNVDTRGGCHFSYSTAAGINSFVQQIYIAPPQTPNQLEADEEIVVASHELFEALTDPLTGPPSGAWFTGYNEIGDECNRMVGGIVSEDGGNVLLNGHSYLVQEVWSNAHNFCALGPSVSITIATGDDNLRGDELVLGQLVNNGSEADVILRGPNGVLLEEVVLKAEHDPEWANGSINRRVFSFPSDSAKLWEVDIRLVQHGGISPDNWKINGVDVEVLNAFGQQVCKENIVGNPILKELTESDAIYAIATPTSCH